MSDNQTSTDVILIGAGVMSATLGTLIKELAPNWKIQVFEKLDKPGEESSNEWNNAGTGHAALCELNYTSEKSDGTMDLTKANNVNEQFQVSKQFWTHLVKTNLIDNPQDFIESIPHISFVQGDDNVRFLKKRYQALAENPLFKGIEYSDELETLSEWMPLMMQDRTTEEPIAATRIASGTDVNFGALTRKLFEHLEEKETEVFYQHTVESIKRDRDGRWNVRVRDHVNNHVKNHTAKFIFIGAGGGSIHLLQKTGIKEGKQMGGFPVSGLFMVCNNPEVIKQHHAKVYGKAKVGAPPMSVPHLDTRFINQEKSLLFGPFAGFSPKFLKTGSNWDLIKSVKPNNLFTMLSAGFKNLPLTKYLIQQVLLSKEQRMEELREFIPNAKLENWDLLVAGQRVQVIKDTEDGGKGTLQFGTEVVTAEDGSIAALLGASPGASTAVSAMLGLLRDCFPEEFKAWEPKIKEMIPSYGKRLLDHPQLIEEIHETTDKALALDV